MIASPLAVWAVTFILSLSGSWSWWSKLFQPVPQPAPAAALGELRLSPEVLAASGFDATSSAALLARLSEAPELGSSLTLARSNLANAQNAVRSCEIAIRHAPRDQELRTGLTAALAAAESAQTALNSARASAVGELCTGGPAAAAQRIVTALDSPISFSDPAFLVGERTAGEARSLRLAEIRAARLARAAATPDPLASQILASARSHPTYIAAAQGVAFNGAAIAALLGGG